MAIRLEDTYPASRITPADADYPAGSLKNETTPGVSDDGTPLDELWGNDFEGLKQWLMDQAGISASGTPDNINNSDLGDGIVFQVIKKMNEFGFGDDVGANLGGGDDLDLVITSGFYAWGSSAPANTPAGTFCLMLVMPAHNTSSTTQVVSDRANNLIFYRNRNSGVWGGWLQLFTSGNEQQIGVGQSWQDVTVSRSAGVTYTNTTGKPIQVSVSQESPNNSSYGITVGGVLIGSFGENGTISGVSILSFHPFIVPDGDTYLIESGAAIQSWVELR